MATLSFDGLTVFYELYGKGHPLILIAGYTCDHNVWRLMIDELAKDFNVLIFDNRGIGQTKDDDKKFTLATMADDTMRLINRLGLEKPHILGQSMGGAIAQLIARKYPNDIDKLVLLNTAAKFNSRTRHICEVLLNARKKEMDLSLLVELSMPWFLGSNFLANSQLYTEFKDALVNNPLLQTIPDQERQFNALCSFDSSAWLEELITPTLIIAAEEDIITLPEEAKYLAEGITKAQLNYVPGGHSSPVEAYQQVNQLIKQFLLD
jgi:pimeloyl-ACP methyl ester carboxylesterase